MPNIDFPRGLQPWKNLVQANYYKVASNYATALFIGDPVITTGTDRNVQIATAGTGNPMVGAIIGCYDSNYIPVTNVAASTGGWVLVADAVSQVFVAQGDGDTSFLDINDCNGNVNLIGGTGSTVNYRSGWEINDSDTGGNTAADQIRLIKPVQMAENTVGTANCLWELRINNHQNAVGIVGVGV